MRLNEYGVDDPLCDCEMCASAARRHSPATAADVAAGCLIVGIVLGALFGPIAWAVWRG